jgi:hypothetical protein
MMAVLYFILLIINHYTAIKEEQKDIKSPCDICHPISFVFV